MNATALPQPDLTMRPSYTVPFFVKVSAASLLASLITNPTATPTSHASALGIDYFEAAFGNATSSIEVSAITLVESVTSDLKPGESFTNAEAAALGFRLAQRRSKLPITELDLGSDV